MQDMKEILKTLSCACGPSGKEDDMFDAVAAVCRGMNVEIKKDKMGSISIFRKGTKRGVIGLFAHIDEIGLMVTKIDGNYIRFTEVGGYDEKVLLSQEVVVYGDKPYFGIVGAKPPHLQSAGESSNMLEFKDLYIDIAMKEAEIRKHIKIGDRILIRSEFAELKNNQVSMKAIDNRGSCAILLGVLPIIDRMKDNYDLHIVLNAQEETTMAGSKTSAHSIFPDVGIVVDVTFAKQPGVDFGLSLEEMGIGCGAHMNKKLFEFTKKLADKKGVKYQIEPLPSHSGTDTGAVQIARNGIATILFSLPIKNMQSPVETVRIETMEKMSAFTAEMISEMDISEFAETIIK